MKPLQNLWPWQTTHASADTSVVSCVKCAADQLTQALHITFAILKDAKKKLRKQKKTGPIGWLGGGFKYFFFSPLFGEDSHFD